MSFISLASTGIASGLILFSLYILNMFVSQDIIKDFRYIYNAAGLISLLFCFGLDTQIVVDKITKQAFKTLFSSFFVVFVILFIINTIIDIYLLHIILVSGIFMLFLLCANYFRANDEYIKYIVFFNIVDKSLRLIAVAVAVYVYLYINSEGEGLSAILRLFEGSLLIALLGIAIYNGFLGAEVKVPKYKLQNILFVASSFLFLFLTKMIYFSEHNASSATLYTLDIYILFLMFIFVPIQNIIKLSEVGGVDQNFLRLSIKQHWVLFTFEAVILIGAVFSIYAFSFILDYSINYFDFYHALTLFILVSFYPNIFQILIHFKRNIEFTVFAVLLISLFVFLFYADMSIYNKYYILYICLIGFIAYLNLMLKKYFHLSYSLNRVARTIVLLLFFSLYGLL